MKRAPGLIPRADMARRIGRGAALLDRECPGWEAEVDPASIRVDEGESCVLGQLHGDYHEAIEALFSGSVAEAAQRGFDLARPGDLYATLGVLWRQQIDDRRQGKRRK